MYDRHVTACNRLPQVEAEGLLSLFRGLPAILFKEIPFVVTKFVVFDQVPRNAHESSAEHPRASSWRSPRRPSHLFTQVVTALALAFPYATDGLAFTVGLPLASGAIAGVFAVLASQVPYLVAVEINTSR